MDRKKLIEQIEAELEKLNDKIELSLNTGSLFDGFNHYIQTRYWLVQTWVALNPYFLVGADKVRDHIFGPHGTTIPVGHGEQEKEKGSA